MTVSPIQNAPLPLSHSVQNNIQSSISGEEAHKKLLKAKSMLYRENMQSNPQAANYILMAEKALKNGNSAAAFNFTDRALNILKPENETHPAVNEDIPAQDTMGSPSYKAKQNKEHYEPEKPESTKHNYQDASNDPGVSFSFPSGLTGPQSFIAVPAHEKEHVSRRVSEAVLNGDRIYVSVSYRIRHDPGTGEAYMAGGTTRTIKFSGYKSIKNNPGSAVNLYV